MGLTFKMFQIICIILDRFVYEPLFWLIISCLVFGTGEVNAGLDGRFYLSRKKRIVMGLISIIWSLMILYWYWFKPYTGGMRI